MECGFKKNVIWMLGHFSLGNYSGKNVSSTGINLRTNGAATKEESPTSDYAEECPSEQGESTCSSVTSSSPLPQPVKNRHPHHIPYDPKVIQ